MKITGNYEEGYILDGVKILNNGTRGVVTLTLLQMWQIHEYMTIVHLRQQIEEYLELRQDYGEFFECGRTAEDMLSDNDLISKCVEDINDGTYGYLGDEKIYRLLEQYA